MLFVFAMILIAVAMMLVFLSVGTGVFYTDVCIRDCPHRFVIMIVCVFHNDSGIMQCRQHRFHNASHYLLR